MSADSVRNTNIFSPRSIALWQLIQTIVWLLGLVIVLSLFFFPQIGLTALWNILIPLAPALLVLSCGLWRNVCPLATTSLLMRHFRVSKRKKMTPSLQGKLQLAAVLLLYLVVPLRHLVFNRNGMASAILLCVFAATAALIGYYYDWKSAWCHGLCPVHPVEKLYGQRTLFTPPNAHCDRCVNCSVPCPDSTPNVNPNQNKKSYHSQVSGLLITGGLPGFILGWFLVPDIASHITPPSLAEVYGLPLLGLSVSLLIYLQISKMVSKKSEQLLVRYFAVAAVSCYYWFRIPALLGFGRYSTDMALFNLRGLLPQWIVSSFVFAVPIFFYWWLIYRKPKKQSWLYRPAFAARQKTAG